MTGGPGAESFLWYMHVLSLIWLVYGMRGIAAYLIAIAHSGMGRDAACMGRDASNINDLLWPHDHNRSRISPVSPPVLFICFG